MCRLKRTINLFSNPMLEVFCTFLDSTLTSLINLTHLSQRHDPAMSVRDDSLSEILWMLLSRFIQPEFVTKLTVGNVIEFYLENSENCLSSNVMFIGIARNFTELQFEDGYINQEQHNKFLSFRKASFLCLIVLSTG